MTLERRPDRFVRHVRHGGPIPVLQVVCRFGVGGSETHSMELLKRLDRSRYEPIVATMTVDGPWRNIVEDLGIEILDFPFSKFTNRQGREHFRNLASAIRERAIPLVHCHDFYSNIFGCVAARLAGRPKVVAARRELGVLRKRHHLLGQRVAFSFADIIITNTADLRRRMIRRELVPSKRIRVVYNGVDAERFAPTDVPEMLRTEFGMSPGAVVVGIVARLTEEKNHPCLFRAVAGLLSRFPELRLLVVGDGPMRQPLNDLATDLGLTNHVIFAGERSDVALLLNLMDVVVLISAAAGCSNAILEAQATGQPVVASAVGGNLEIVNHEVDGFLVPHDDPIALAERLATLLGDIQLRQAFGRAGRQKVVTQFSYDRVIETVEGLYCDLLGPHGAGGSCLTQLSIISAPGHLRPVKHGNSVAVA